MENKEKINPILDLIVGIVLFVVGMVLLLTHIDVSGNVGFFMIGRISSGPVILVLIATFIIVAVITRKKFWWYLVVGGVVLLIVSVILGTRVTFTRMNALTLILMLGTFAAGIGFLISYLIRRKPAEE